MYLNAEVPVCLQRTAEGSPLSQWLCPPPVLQNLALGHSLLYPDLGPLQPSSCDLVSLKRALCTYRVFSFLVIRLSHWVGLIQ